MASFVLTIPDELLPGLQAEFNLLTTQGDFPFGTPEEYLQASAVELLRQRCQAYHVGPYYVGPVPPPFNPDGSLYQPPSHTEAVG